ncbi:CGNR zinc finger domain-containing protein [Kitasatospora nipponensis]|uniref:CGNR zinc finger domain-containing protein n=1 Tax=Kitasatospora nipponensis TaxID=258049 RepID=A0ABP4GFA7_9ACTN
MRYIRRVPPTPDDWSTRHSVLATARRTAALVNALAVEDPTPEAIAAVLREHGEPEPIDLDEDDVAAMRAVAQLLREVLAATETGVAARELNLLLARTTGALRLTSHGGAAPWHPHLDGDDDAPWGEWFLASSCLAMTVLIWDQQRPPGGLCAASGCRNVYLTQGSGLPRRYCSRRCATRERVAAHRRAHG